VASCFPVASHCWLRYRCRVTRKAKSTPNRVLSSLIQTIPLKQKSMRLKGFGLLPGWACFLAQDFHSSLRIYCVSAEIMQHLSPLRQEERRMRLVKSLSIKWHVTPLPFLLGSDNRRLWARGSLLFRKSGIIQEEGTGNREAYVHRHLDESVHRVTYTDTVTGSVWSRSPFPRFPKKRGPADSRIQHLVAYAEWLGKTASSRWHVPSHSCALLA
jgi:hypothetical protein